MDGHTVHHFHSNFLLYSINVKKIYIFMRMKTYANFLVYNKMSSGTLFTVGKDEKNKNNQTKNGKNMIIYVFK